MIFAGGCNIKGVQNCTPFFLCLADNSFVPDENEIISGIVLSLLMRELFLKSYVAKVRLEVAESSGLVASQVFVVCWQGAEGKFAL